MEGAWGIHTELERVWNNEPKTEQKEEKQTGKTGSISQLIFSFQWQKKSINNRRRRSFDMSVTDGGRDFIYINSVVEETAVSTCLWQTAV